MTKPREMLAKQIRRLGKSGTLHSVRRLAFALISGDFRNVPPIAQHALPAGQAGVITAYVARLGLDKDRLMAATALIYVASGAFLLGALALQVR